MNIKLIAKVGIILTMLSVTALARANNENGQQSSAAPSLRSYADGTNECTKLNIQIANNTGENCHLVSYHFTHGSLDSTDNVPSSIRADDSKNFQASQILLGSIDMTMTYDCGGKEVTLNSQQDACVLWAGGISGKVNSTDGIIASFSAQPGSAFYYTHGTMDWSLKQ